MWHDFTTRLNLTYKCYALRLKKLEKLTQILLELAKFVVERVVDSAFDLRLWVFQESAKNSRDPRELGHGALNFVGGVRSLVPILQNFFAVIVDHTSCSKICTKGICAIEDLIWIDWAPLLCGYRIMLKFKRLWVRIPPPDTERKKINEKRASLKKYKLNNPPQFMHQNFAVIYEAVNCVKNVVNLIGPLSRK